MYPFPYKIRLNQLNLLQGSSIGAYSTSWTNEFISSARGVSPETWLDTPKKVRKASHPSDLKIVFPSLNTVDASVLGRPVRHAV